MKTISMEQAHRTGLGRPALTPIPYTSYGDYAGDGLVGKANFEVLSKKLNRFKGIYAAYGWFGYWELYYNESELTQYGRETLDEILGALSDYPLISDEHYSNMEWALKQELISEFEQDYGELSEELYTELFDAIRIENDYAYVDEEEFAKEHGLERL